MSSIALKFSSLAIRTLSKPIANYIKRQAREHPGFRKTCISFAQSVHRVDVRWRIGLLQDAAALEKQAQREASKKKQSSIPTVKTEAQTKADEVAAKEADETGEKRPPPKVRPLSEAKAIETGANFISETFLFSVAAGLILFETWRSRRKESNRRDIIKDRIDDLEEERIAERKAFVAYEEALILLEKEVIELRAQHPGMEAPTRSPILPGQLYKPPKENDSTDEASQSWYSRIANYISIKDNSGPKTEQLPKEPEQGPAAKVLAGTDRMLEENDRARDEKHRKQAEEDAAIEAAEASAKPKKNSS